MCEHETIKDIRVTKTLGKHTFAYTSKECQECHAVLETPETRKEYLNNLNEFYSEHKDSFTVQGIRLPQYVQEVIERIKSEYTPSEVSASDVIKAMVIVYTDKVMPDEQLSQALEAHFNMCSLSAGTIGREKVRFRPQTYLRIHAVAEGFFGETTAEYCASCCERIVLLFLNDVEMNEYERRIAGAVREFLEARAA